MTRVAVWAFVCVIVWQDVYPLGDVMGGRSFQEVRQEMCVTDTRAVLMIQRRIYEERTDEQGRPVQDEIVPWKAMMNQDGVIWAVSIPRDRAWSFDPKTMMFNPDDAANVLKSSPMEPR